MHHQRVNCYTRTRSVRELVLGKPSQTTHGYMAVVEMRGSTMPFAGDSVANSMARPRMRRSCSWEERTRLRLQIQRHRDTAGIIVPDMATKLGTPPLNMTCPPPASSTASGLQRFSRPQRAWYADDCGMCERKNGM